MSELEELPSWAGRSVPKNPSGAASDAKSDSRSDKSDASAEAPSDATETTQLQPDIAATSAANAAVNNSPLQAAPMAEQPAAAPVVQPQYAERRRRPLAMFLFGFLGLCALAGMAALGYFLAQSQNSNETEASVSETTDEVAEEDQAAGETAAGDAAEDTATETADDGAAEEDSPSPAEETEADEADGGQLTVDTDQDAADADTAASDDGTGDQTEEVDGTATAENDRQAVFRGGKVYLSGSVPSEEVGMFIQQRAEAVVGEGNVVNEYQIDPTVVIEEGSSAPLYVEDVVLFEFNSIEVAQPFLPILDLGTLLLRQNPQASVTVVTRTDAIGSEEANLEVSRLRAQAVINYWLGKGVNPDQIEARPLGEEGASEDDDEQTAALNRRAEFIITGLLD